MISFLAGHGPGMPIEEITCEGCLLTPQDSVHQRPLPEEKSTMEPALSGSSDVEWAEWGRLGHLHL